MAFYGNEDTWSAPPRQPSWEQQPAPPSRSGPGSSLSQAPPEPHAFAAQFEEIDRATDNLVRSGKWFPGAMQPMGGVAQGMSPVVRRESIPAPRGGYDYSGSPGGGDARMGGSGGQGSRHQSMSEYDGGRPGSAGLQGYYQGQRFPGGRQSEAEQMLQAKRRMAAQRERELRNYHQEQQYNRTVSGGKSDRSMSPNTMSEDDRRDLIARQHRALYGDNSSMYGSDGSSSRPQSQDVRAGTSGRGGSPLAFDPYNVQVSHQGGEGVVQMPPRDRTASTASPVSNQQQQQQQQQAQYNLIDPTQQQQQQQPTSTSSPPSTTPPPTGSNQQPQPQTQKPTSAQGPAPIGTRPVQPPAPANNSATKRSTTPLTPSALSYGYSADPANPNSSTGDERSTSAASNPGAPAAAEKGGVQGLGAWGGSGVWGGGKGLAVQPSVWG